LWPIEMYYHIIRLEWQRKVWEVISQTTDMIGTRFVPNSTLDNYVTTNLLGSDLLTVLY
jgi:hypothetical protein